MSKLDDGGRSEQEAAHDVLAAEAFAVPGPDPALHHGPVSLPEDPTGIAEAHDILAAEEFAMPAVHLTHSGAPAVASRPQRSARLGGAAAALLTLIGLWRRGRR